MATPEDRAVERAIAHVGEVFAGLAARPDETGCGRCYHPDEVALLRTAGAELPPALVEMVAEESPGHWDDQPAVIRRVLPQLVPLLARGTAIPDQVGRGLAAAGWTRWPDRQAGAVRGFLEAWWIRSLRQDAPPTPVREVFESCATASSSVAPWLDLWGAERGPTVRRHLAECADWWSDDLRAGVSPFTWWWGGEEQDQAACRELLDWLDIHA